MSRTPNQLSALANQQCKSIFEEQVMLFAPSFVVMEQKVSPDE
jgi:hypothetical protein